MAWHLYLLPIIGTTDRLPKYIEALGVSWSMRDYGQQPECLVAADVSAAQHSSIIGNGDVQFIPDNLDQQIGGALSTVEAALSSRHIPDGWVTSNMTYRFVIRKILGAFKFLVRFHIVSGISAPAINGANVTLNTQFQDLGANARQGLLDTAATFKLDISDFSGTSTLRQILKGVCDQLTSGPIQMGGIVI